MRRPPRTGCCGYLRLVCCERGGLWGRGATKASADEGLRGGPGRWWSERLLRSPAAWSLLPHNKRVPLPPEQWQVALSFGIAWIVSFASFMFLPGWRWMQGLLAVVAGSLASQVGGAVESPRLLLAKMAQAASLYATYHLMDVQRHGSFLLALAVSHASIVASGICREPQDDRQDSENMCLALAFAALVASALACVDHHRPLKPGSDKCSVQRGEDGVDRLVYGDNWRSSSGTG